MKHWRAIFVVSLVSQLVAAGQSSAFPTGAFASLGGTASSSYAEGANGTQTLYDMDGIVSTVVSNQNQSGNKELVASGMAQTAILIPDAASVNTPDVYADAALTTPLVVGGLLVVLSPDAGVAADAEALQPAPVGFTWVGYSTQGLLNGVTGAVSTSYFLVYTFSSYPTPSQVGSHFGKIYSNDETPATPHLIVSYVGYQLQSAPAIGEWGLVILALVALAVSGLTVYRRGLSAGQRD